MANISLQNIDSYTYVYVSKSYRDELKRPRNEKIKIGKIDHKSKELVISPEHRAAYGNLLEAKIPEWEKRGLIVNAKAKLEASLKKNFPDNWQRILAVIRQVLK